MCFTIVLKIPFDFPKIFGSHLLLKFLLAFIMVNPISLQILLASFVTIILCPLILYVCECTQSSVDPYKLYFQLLSNMNWISTNQIAIDCTPKPTQLIHPWSECCFWSLDLEIIIPLQLSFELDSCFYNLTSLHSFFLWLSTDAHIRSLVDHQNLLSDFIRQRPSYSISLWAFPRIHNAFGKLYPLLSQAYSTIEFALFILEMCGIYS